VSNGRDEIDTWLEREVTPLMPPPGSLDRIRRTARRRKTTQAVIAAAGCAVIIGAAATVPQLISGTGHGAAPRPPLAGANPSARSLSARPGARPRPQTFTSTPIPAITRSYLSATSSGVPVPADFRPTSVTFVGNGSGGEVGAVIGQAGDASHPCATRDCTSLAGTSAYGTTWYGVSAPETPGPDGATGVSQLRFATLKAGWAFGPALWETSNGGWPWTQESTGGLRVTDLEAASGHALAIFASCTGSGQDYAAGCTRFSLYGSVAGSTTWTPIAVPAADQPMTTSAASAATLVISGGDTGYLLTPAGEVLTGPVSGGTWTQAGKAPCSPTGAQASGQPDGIQLAAGPSLVLACDQGASAAIYTSADGQSWKLAGTAPVAGTATALAAASSGTIVLATTAGIDYATAAGAGWHAAKITGTPAGGFTYIGMTTPQSGVAVPADAALSEVFVTSDGGQTWHPSRITS
jgi:hypothetical protein